ncbi:hypothetical protein [Pseudactinotalea sp. Z1732]|uniref:hypothetical protein n=1 Tax=Pseudactinotalea sp. Z1732 TaxID=3413026 RepID=UPI003C7A7707
MTLTPLPVPTRVYGGEGVDTYARRAATRNGTQARWIDKMLWETGTARTLSPHHPARLQAWRELGGLHESAFTTPDTINGEWVTDRDLCIQCTRGNPAHGQLPRVGLVCVRHRRWLGAPGQPRLHAHPELLTAERHYRARLATRDVMFDSPPMLVGAECARVALSPSTITARQDRAGLSLDAVIYPEHVAFARLVTSPGLLTWVTDPGTDPAAVRRLLDARARHVVPEEGNNEPWRASTRLQTILFRVRSFARNAPPGAPVTDPWGLLRHTTLDTGPATDGQAQRLCVTAGASTTVPTKDARNAASLGVSTA